MKIGLVLFSGVGSMDGATPTGRDIVNFSKLAEQVGLDSVWLTDHFYFDFADFAAIDIPLPPELDGTKSGAWECWSLVSAIAAVTRTINVGTLIASTSFRNPTLLARMAETVDDISNGRLILGLGAGDFAFEHRSAGYAFDRQISRFEEAIEIISKLLKGQQVSLDGEFYNVHEAKILPKGPRPEGPPLLVGSVFGRPRMTRLTLQHADFWNCFIAFGENKIEQYRDAWTHLQVACDKYARDPATVRRSVSLSVSFADSPFPIPGTQPISGSIAEIADALSEFADEGIEHCMIMLHPYTSAGIEQLGRVIESVTPRGSSKR
ncbi:MAG: alkanesulfonate monooxygenase SsuD [Gammaproteobacteria bacterium]